MQSQKLPGEEDLKKFEVFNENEVGMDDPEERDLSTPKFSAAPKLVIYPERRQEGTSEGICNGNRGIHRNGK